MASLRRSTLFLPGVLVAIIAIACGTSDPAPPQAAPQADADVDGSAPTSDASSDAIPGEDDGGAALLVATEIVGRPTAQSVAVSVVPAQPLEAYVEVGTTSGIYDRTTPTKAYPATEPFIVSVDGLAANTRYVYRLRFRGPGETVFHAGPVRAFHTQRPPGSTFRFTLQADSHLDENSDYAAYKQTLANVGADAPDFHIDLGDTFMCDKHSLPLSDVLAACPDAATVNARYLYERGNFGLMAHSVPLFLVNGNHDAETGFLLTPGGQDVATWATLARKRYFLNPTPDGFYTGDPSSQPNVGQRASWYAWHWGDALFVALDPFWNTTKKSNADGWVWTLGEAQYRWLAQTLASSTAKYKFVFLHNLVGGLDGQMRGGVEAAPYYEWGGKNADGSDGFAEKRPGWSKPIHQLLVDANVSAVFHGHDHLYAKQSLDGVVYQEVPQPSARNTKSGPNLAASYHYESGTIASAAGHVRVTIEPDNVTVEYVRSWLPASESATQKNGQIDDTYTITKP